MPNEFISKMAKYVAFLYREADIWEHETGWTETVNLFMTKIETVRDICAMFGCRAEVWAEAVKVYDFNKEKTC